MEKNIPVQQEGGHSDTVSTAEFSSEELAKRHFEIVKKRFFDVNSWELFAGEETADFTLVDFNGKTLTTEPQKGNYFKINIPGPNNRTGNKYDWVQVEHTEYTSENGNEQYLIRVRPCINPLNSEEETAHFFDDDATSTFLIRREKKRIFAEVHGRNEKPNTENLGIVEKIRNTIVAIGGILGGSKFQWNSLTEGLLKTNDSEKE